MPLTQISLDTIEKLDALIADSHDRPVFLFKHSDTCGISAHILEQLNDIDGDVNILVVQYDREVSNAVVERLGIRHASPQAFVLKDGKPIYHATHYGIDPDEIAKHLK
ncbi:MAG TPA: bacillithiol system redox-active protein YtxJ [Pyrinomonadaceae bacterium]|nr:bacillithiol system redox-active protein YtxJ [Pyrinomonadaceae bacterium]